MKRYNLHPVQEVLLLFPFSSFQPSGPTIAKDSNFKPEHPAINSAFITARIGKLQ